MQALSTRPTAGFNVFFELSVVHVIPRIIAVRFIATEPKYVPSTLRAFIDFLVAHFDGTDCERRWTQRWRSASRCTSPSWKVLSY
jgi:hypothetical protein